MKKISILSLLGFCLLLFACTSGEKPSDSSDGLKEATGGVYYGGVFRYNEESYLRHLFPLNIKGTIGHRITTNLYEGLLVLRQNDLEPVPGLAESWTISEDGLTYTFKIRKGVNYHDDPCFPDGKGREVNAHDFKYVFDLLCADKTKEQNNEGTWTVEDRIKGVKAWQQSIRDEKEDPKGVEGVQVVDDYTLTITLNEPSPDFLKLLALPFCYAFPKEAYEKYGSSGMRIHAVGTGPFFLKNVKENEAVIMRRNENYWGKDKHGNQLPYLDGIRVSFIKEQKTSLLEFNKGNLHMVYRLPLEMVDEVLDENQQLRDAYKQFDLQMQSTLGFQYYGFQHQTKPFDNKKLRQAFCYAVDREKIVKFIVKGMGDPSIHGVVPIAMKNHDSYDPTQVKGFNYDPEKARRLLAEAGYPGGKGLDKVTLQVNVGGGKNVLVAEAVQKQITETLNIDVDILQLQFSQHYETIETAKTNFFRAGWVADYTSAENFLKLYYGPMAPESIEEKTYMNTPRYKNKNYDRLFEQAVLTMDNGKRNALYRQAEQLLVEDAVVLPLFFDKDVRLIQPEVRNFPMNGMEYRRFLDVYLTPKAAAVAN